MGFYRQFYLAITDFRLYAAVFEQPIRKTLRYLLYLSAHLAVFQTAVMGWSYFPAVDDFFRWANANFPPFQVNNGILTMKADPPVKLMYKNEEMKWTFVFDTTGTYKDTQGLEAPVFLFVEDRLTLHYLAAQTQTYLWKDLPDMQFPRDLSMFQTLFNWIFVPGAYSLWLLWSLAAKSLQGFVLAPIAFFTGSLYGIRLGLANTFTIAIYALTPAVVIDAALQLTGLELSYAGVIYLVVAAIYTYMATVRCAMAN